jgi:hypothetical protein
LRRSKSSRFGLISLTVVLNLCLFAASFFFISANMTIAQNDKGDTPSGSGGVRYDIYPHPLSQGALAYTLADRWDYTDLTYYFHNCPSTINCNAGWEAVREAFQSWEGVSPLTFTEVDSASQADIELSWELSGPYVGYPGDVLAFATFPSDGGDVVFDDSEPWSVFDGSEFDLYLVAAHEIGHALGLDHSSEPDALMYPVLTRSTTGITNDDAAAIQALYGRPDDRPPQDVPDQTTAEEASGFISDEVPYELWEFEAFAGETLTITMTATSGNLDPYLGLLTDDEETVLAESDAVGDTASLTYTFDADGTYVVVATRDGVDEGFSSGSYVLSLDTSDTSQASPTDTAGGVLVAFQSYNPIDLCEIYLSPSTQEEWGDNLLTGPMSNGNYIEIAVTPDTYDVLAVTCDETTLETYEIPISEDLTIEIYEDEINLWVYES